MQRLHCYRALLAALGLVLMTMGLWGAFAPNALAQRLSFIRDAEVEDLLNIYSLPIFRAAGLGSGRVKIRIVRSPAFNAFVLDGRNVFMNTGTLMQAETPGQVIGVIAHEAGHIAGGHIAGLRAKIKRDQTRLLLMKILGIGALAAGAASGSEQASDISGGIGKSILTGSDGVAMRSILSYRRVQESAADQAAVSYLNATRQSSRGMLETFERLAQQELFSTRYQDQYVRSHPMARQRVVQLRTLASRSPHFEKKDSANLQLRHDLMRAKLSGYLDRPQTVFNRYPNSDRSLPALYARAIGSYFAGGLSAALPKVDALIRKKTDYAYFWELKGELLVRSGRPGEAVIPLKKALQLSNGNSLIRVRLAQAMLGTKNKKYLSEAIKVLRKSLVEEKSAFGYRQLATAYWEQGHQGQAYLSTALAYFHEGKLKDAKRFAMRAQKQFSRGSSAWIKADDIVKYGE